MSCKLSPLETICMQCQMETICTKCQILFSGKIQKSITNLSSAELAWRVVKVIAHIYLAGLYTEEAAAFFIIALPEPTLTAFYSLQSTG